MICVLSGGTGTPKLLQGIKKLIPEEEICVIVNTLENDYFSGIYVSADVDTVLYTLSDLINEEYWYGRRDDTFKTHEELLKLGYKEVLRIGDKDRALKIQKTQLLKDHTLTEAVNIQRKALGIKAKVLPMSDEKTEVHIISEGTKMTFHEFLVEKQGQPSVDEIITNTVHPTPEVLEALKESEKVIIGPSNPITSIMPIINMKGIRKLMEDKYVVSVSPIIGENAFSGPAGKFMKTSGYDVSPVGVARIYSDIVDHYIINTSDNKYKHSINEFIPRVSCENIILKSLENKINLAKKIL